MRSEMARPEDNGGGTAIRAEGLGKHYQLGELHSLQQTLNQVFRRSAIQEAPSIEALRDVDFEVAHGEAFGIVGTNGSGKSTMLQVLAGTIVPTAGSLTVQGRVLPLLAVGAGFHPELTGNE